MTLATCERLLAHYESVNNKEGAEEMRFRIERYGAKPLVVKEKGKAK